MPGTSAPASALVRCVAHEFETSRGFNPVGDRLNTLAQALDALDRAITEAGPQPVWHERMMERHRREWPTLWAALDAIRRA